MQSKWIYSVLRLSSRLPLPLNQRLGELIGRLFFYTSRRYRRITEINIAKCFPDLSNKARRNLVRQTMIETGKTFTESGLIWFGEKQQLTSLIQEVHGEQHLLEGISRGKGVIIALPHLGNWEVFNIYCAPRFGLTSLYRPPRITALDPIIRHARERFGGSLVPTDIKGVRSLYQALDKNKVVIILPDQEPRDKGGQFAPFFGIQTHTMTLLSRLAQKSKATVLCAYAERLNKGRGFAIHFYPITEDIYDERVERSVAALNQTLEKIISNVPMQYQWNYKRFRTRPPGEKSFYSEH